MRLTRSRCSITVWNSDTIEVNDFKCSPLNWSSCINHRSQSKIMNNIMKNHWPQHISVHSPFSWIHSNFYLFTSICNLFLSNVLHVQIIFHLISLTFILATWIHIYIQVSFYVDDDRLTIKFNRFKQFT